MHYRLEPEAEIACHDLRHVRQSVWQLHLHIHFRQCHYGLTMVIRWGVTSVYGLVVRKFVEWLTLIECD